MVKLVECLRCGQKWDKDPILLVPCPTCQASVGRRCKRPSGHEAVDFHADRDYLAMKKIHGYGKCPGAVGEIEL